MDGKGWRMGIKVNIRPSLLYLSFFCVSLAVKDMCLLLGFHYHVCSLDATKCNLHLNPLFSHAEVGIGKVETGNLRRDVCGDMDSDTVAYQKASTKKQNNSK
ncbi:hypothetical protein QBC42DRAFT_267979 [Cladorrhinum samala]|uniref:Uncharacterized protein n=1 Tax=Cladorrhinum samala TaxID=585594 RepID=A0AAV9HNL0_9PEZI|nr:hypothetical protein QBC42DRAFT_267979 [Cladorrhinum samala]